MSVLFSPVLKDIRLMDNVQYHENTVQEKGKAMLPGKMHGDKVFQLEMYFAALLLAFCLPSCGRKDKV